MAAGTMKRSREIREIQNRQKKHVTFSKRRATLFQHAKRLCGGKDKDKDKDKDKGEGSRSGGGGNESSPRVAIIVFSPGGRPYLFGNPDLIDRYLSHSSVAVDEQRRMGPDNVIVERATTTRGWNWEESLNLNDCWSFDALSAKQEELLIMKDMIDRRLSLLSRQSPASGLPVPVNCSEDQGDKSRTRDDVEIMGVDAATSVQNRDSELIDCMIDEMWERNVVAVVDGCTTTQAGYDGALNSMQYEEDYSELIDGFGVEGDRNKTQARDDGAVNVTQYEDNCKELIHDFGVDGGHGKTRTRNDGAAAGATNTTSSVRNGDDKQINQRLYLLNRPSPTSVLVEAAVINSHKEEGVKSARDDGAFNATPSSVTQNGDKAWIEDMLKDLGDLDVDICCSEDEGNFCDGVVSESDLAQNPPLTPATAVRGSEEETDKSITRTKDEASEEIKDDKWIEHMIEEMWDLNSVMHPHNDEGNCSNCVISEKDSMNPLVALF